MRVNYNLMVLLYPVAVRQPSAGSASLRRRPAINFNATLTPPYFCHDKRSGEPKDQGKNGG